MLSSLVFLRFKLYKYSKKYKLDIVNWKTSSHFYIILAADMFYSYFLFAELLKLDLSSSAQQVLKDNWL